MNYIASLRLDKQALEAEVSALRAGLDAILEYVQSEKFGDWPYVSTAERHAARG